MQYDTFVFEKESTEVLGMFVGDGVRNEQIHFGDELLELQLTGHLDIAPASPLTIACLAKLSGTYPVQVGYIGLAPAGTGKCAATLHITDDVHVKSTRSFTVGRDMFLKLWSATKVGWPEKETTVKVPTVEDPTDKLILEMVTKDPSLSDEEIGRRLPGPGLTRGPVNARRRALEKAGHRVR